MTRSRILVFAFTILAVAAAAAGQSTPAASNASSQAPAGNAANGKKLFTTIGCYQCHGYEAQGSTATGPRLAPRPLPFAALSKYVRRPTGQMPPYTTKVLSDMELADIYAFLMSVPAAPATPPLLK
jgi:ubiquinol-cytochrome c reductase cytochrome c subunit